MNEPSISPMSGFWIIKNSELSDVEVKNLIKLYQPLVGTTAIGLYLLLWGESQKKLIISERLSHSHIFSMLDYDAKTFYQNRIKLEAIGLLKSYKKEDQLGEFYIYELFNPVTPADFFNDSLLSILLLEKIGRNDFENISSEYEAKKDVLKDASDVTKSFLEVFKLSDNDILNTPSVVNEAQAKVNNIDSNKPKINKQFNNVLDWNFLGQLVNQYGISMQELEKKEDDIYSLYIFYGMDELDLSILIARSINPIDNTINIKKLKRQAQKKYENQTNISERIVENNDVKLSKDPLINRANSLIPSEFLADEKHLSGGFVGTSETRVLKKLQNRHVLPDSVINILIHYVLGRSATLSEGLVEKVANDWVQNKVNSSEDAVKRINDFGTVPRKRNNKTNVERGTDWKKVNSEKNDDSFDADKLIEEANARFKRLSEDQSK